MGCGYHKPTRDAALYYTLHRPSHPRHEQTSIGIKARLLKYRPLALKIKKITFPMPFTKQVSGLVLSRHDWPAFALGRVIEQSTGPDAEPTNTAGVEVQIEVNPSRRRLVTNEYGRRTARVVRIDNDVVKTIDSKLVSSSSEDLVHPPINDDVHVGGNNSSDYFVLTVKHCKTDPGLLKCLEGCLRDLPTGCDDPLPPLSTNWADSVGSVVA